MDRLHYLASMDSGIFGATAACIGKLGLDSDSPLSTVVRHICGEGSNSSNSFVTMTTTVVQGVLREYFGKLSNDSVAYDDAFVTIDVCTVASLITRVICLVLMILTNV